jgi:hypothetical protein
MLTTYGEFKMNLVDELGIEVADAWERRAFSSHTEKHISASEILNSSLLML